MDFTITIKPPSNYNVGTILNVSRKREIRWKKKDIGKV